MAREARTEPLDCSRGAQSTLWYITYVYTFIPTTRRLKVKCLPSRYTVVHCGTYRLQRFRSPLILCAVFIDKLIYDFYVSPRNYIVLMSLSVYIRRQLCHPAVVDLQEFVFWTEGCNYFLFYIMFMKKHLYNQYKRDIL